MDALAGLLDGPRARGAFMLRALLRPPWSLRDRSEAPLTVAAMVQGDAWMIPDAGEPVLIRPGDIVVSRGPDHFTFADDPATPVQIVIHPGQDCFTPDGIPMRQAMDLGVRTWGHPDGTTVMLIGVYELDGEVPQRLLAALPSMFVLPGETWSSPLVPLLGEEIVKDEPGQSVVLDRLLDLLLIAVLRTWFSRPDAEPPAWFQAHGDPVVGRALRMLHNSPSHQWTVARLAAEIGVSRAALARRFTELVGEPPMAYLTGWRLALAADLLREPDATIAAVARQVGYANPFALSTAFKRVRGISPQEYRTGAGGLQIGVGETS